VQCIQAGQASVVVNVTEDGQPQGDLTLTLDAPESAAGMAVVDGYLIQILDLEPYPHSQTQTQDSDYVLTISVSQ
jgi:hypothetical protein